MPGTMINPVKEGSANEGHRTVSIIFLAYNHEPFVEQALRSILVQNYYPLEIIISDDRSRDATFDVLRRILSGYKGPHKVILRQNATTLGVARNLSTCLRCVSGQIVVMAHSDDVSLPDRVNKIAKHFAQMGSSNMLSFSDYTEIDAAGSTIGEVTVSVKAVNWTKPHIPGTPPGGVMAFRRTVFDFFGEIHPDVQGSEDDVMFFRASLLGTVTRIPEKLVLKRLHGKNPSATPPKRDLLWYKQKYQRLSAVWKQRQQDLHLWQENNPDQKLKTERMLHYISQKIAQCDAYLMLASGDRQTLLMAMKQLAISGGKLLRGLKLFWLASRE